MSVAEWRLDKGHWAQTGVLALMAGSMLASATYFIVGRIDEQEIANQAALSAEHRMTADQMSSQRELFETAIMGVSTRVTALEGETTTTARAVDHLSSTLDQLRTALTDLTIAQTKMEAAAEKHR